jgi:hypothetical protein
MTRRKLLHQLLGSATAVALVSKWLITKAKPRKFVQALRVKKYPGSLRHIGNVCSQGKWSG